MSLRSIVAMNDKLLMELADYSVTEGGTIVATEAQKKDPAEAQRWLIELTTKRSQLFREYKSLLKRGEFTFDELENRVFSEYGITEPLKKAEEAKHTPMGFSMKGVNEQA